VRVVSTMMIPPPRAEGFSTTTDVPLYWREDGPLDGSPMLLLHGGPGAHHDYLYPQLLRLAESHRLIAYDQRGGGKSKTDDPTPITWRTQVEDLTKLWREFALAESRADAPTLVGYSWGALLAMLYCIEAQRSSATVTPMPMPSRLVLLSPAPISRAWRTEFERALQARMSGPAVLQLRAELVASGLRERDPVAYRQRSFELSVAGYFADPRRAESLTPFRVTGRVQQSIWDSLGEFDLQDDLRTLARAVRLPVLVVHGQADPIPLASTQAAAVALDAICVEVPDCGHVPYVEQPELLFEAMARFVPA